MRPPEALDEDPRGRGRTPGRAIECPTPHILSQTGEALYMPVILGCQCLSSRQLISHTPQIWEIFAMVTSAPLQHGDIVVQRGTGVSPDIWTEPDRPLTPRWLQWPYYGGQDDGKACSGLTRLVTERIVVLVRQQADLLPVGHCLSPKGPHHGRTTQGNTEDSYPRS